MNRIKTFAAALLLMASALWAQSGTLTDPIYFASKPAVIRALQDMKTQDGVADLSARAAKAAELNKAGIVIDWAIDVWGWSPSLVMNARQQYGYRWCPNGFQPNPPLADLADPTKAFPRSIKVSTDAADYPSLTPPAPKVPSDGVTWYFDEASGTYGVVAASVMDQQGQWLYQEGQQLLYKDKTVWFHLSYSIMGTAAQFVTRKPQ